MACGDDLKTQLSRYVDGELSPEERAVVDGHVADCAPCRELLQIFQKNESLLSNALSTESFGNAVIESVINEIKNEAPPIEAKPFEESFRYRPALALAAAALLVVGLIVVLNSSHSRDLKKMEEQIAVLSQKMQAQADGSVKLAEEQERLIVSLRSERAMAGTERATMLGAIAPQSLLVRSSFDPKVYSSYDVFRRSEGEANDQFRKLNGDRRLESPEYFDSSVRPGNAYVYKFRAYRSSRNDDFIESLAITMRMARMPEYAAEKSIRVQCIDIGVTHKVAKFQLHRVVNGQPVSQEFVIKPGDRLGELRDVPGFGNVDFRTNLALEKLEDGNQTLPIRYTRALLDANGKEVIDRILKDGTVEVKTVEEDGVLSIRPNLRALFRAAGAAQADTDLWKGSWILVRAQQ